MTDIGSDERYRAYMENTTEAIWRFELEVPVDISTPPDEQIAHCYRYGYLAECNDAMARMYGFDSKDEIVGARLGDLVVESDPANIEYLRAFIASGYRLVGAESHEVDREGTEKFFINNLVGIIADGKLLRAWGTQRDATEEKQLERARAELVERLELLADVTAGLLGSSLDDQTTMRELARTAVPRFADWCFVDIIDEAGNVDRVAVAHRDPEMVKLAIEMRRRYPTSADALAGPPYTIRTGATQAYAIDDALLAQFAQSEEHLAMLRAFGFRSALVVPLSARGRRLGALSFVMAESPRTFVEEDVRLAEDIGRRAGLAIDNARLYRELERANRAKDEFLAMLSHELRTPMTATLGWAAMLQRGGLGNELTALASDSIAQSTRAQARLIDDLLDISRIVSGKMQLSLCTFDLADAVEAAVATIRPAAEAKQIRLGVQSQSEDALRLYGDPERLQQVFWNLLSNAVKFTPRGGEITVTISDDADGCARIVVRDSGDGISSDLLPHIFERFRQGDSGASRRFGGLGLGLSIARNLVELHGGTLTAASDGAGRGAELTVVIPTTAEAHDDTLASPAIDPPAPLAGVALLLVEDDDPTRLMLEISLRRLGADVTAAVDAAQAFAALSSRRFDAVISDIGLPNEDGCALMQRVRAGGNTVPAIALTAYASNAERERALACGFQSWLTKPVEEHTLVEEIRRIT